MEIVKKNLISIICGVVAVVAMVAAFWPLGGYFGDLQTELDKSKAREVKAAGLVTKPRMTPIVVPGQKQEKLVGFPTPGLITATTQAQTGLKTEGRNIVATAVADNMREFIPSGRTLEIADLNTFDPTIPQMQGLMLLTPGSLPNPDANAPFAFQRALEAELKKLRDVVLQGGTPPGPAEIDKAEKALRAEKDKQLQFPDPGKPAINEAQVTADYEEERVKIPDALRAKTAQQIMIYIEPGVLQVDPTMKSGTLSKEQIWYSQVALWIQEDVARAIAETNAMPRPGGGSKPANVTESLVKRLARLEIPRNSSIYQRAVNEPGAMGGGAVPTPEFGSRGMRGGNPIEGGGGGAGTGSLDAIPGASEPPKPNLTISPSGRSCNALYDVVHFNLVVDVDARAAQMFINQLSRGRLIAVRKVDITRPDMGEATDKGYIYSNGKSAVPVIQLNLDCEGLMLRDWTIPLMPGGQPPRTSIREMFAVPPTWTSLLAPPKKAE